ncbi:response regulator [Methylogaea oryzae]|uniref:Response regulatory domain-containing protein n=1 Tax=Methylogaea oryzae TaxID=1295382 RepID=A0A8D5AJA6_9GAMM|nr:response regulator [Methylogaea oryzae]BBL69856.1 hypothetical protein MoryE10_04620 [Methylogaea oryzae]
MFEKKTALVVVDSVPIAQIIGQLLRNELKFDSVLNANGGMQGLQLFQAEPVDWIFADFEIPQMNGLELLTAVRELDKGKYTPFVLMTAQMNMDTCAKAVEIGASDVMAKPFTPAAFIQRVRRIAETTKRRQPPPAAVNKPNQANIVFSLVARYKAEVVSVSPTGCLLRCQPFRDGGMIYDTCQLGLELKGVNVAAKGLLVRMEIDRNKAANKSMLVAFQFLEIDDAGQQAIKDYQAQTA